MATGNAFSMMGANTWDIEDSISLMVRASLPISMGRS